MMKNRKDTSGGMPVDVYSLIRSREIRDFFRENVKLGIYEQEQLILHSYIPIQQKMAMLKQLSYTGDEKESGLINEMYGFFAGYLEQIYHPAVRTVFILECVEMYLDKSRIGINSKYMNVFDTVDEAVMEMEQFIGECEVSPYGLVSVVQVPPDEKIRQPFEFSLFRIDGKWQIKDIIIYDIDRSETNTNSISEDTSYRFSANGFSHPLPFEHGCRLKLQMPFMEEPFYGILSSKKDKNGDWKHFLYDENVGGKNQAKRDFIDLSYAEIALCSGYSSLDWVERA